ncbi:MAG: M24 family metallopeptidase [Planctomycetota bacterium]
MSTVPREEIDRRCVAVQAELSQLASAGAEAPDALLVVQTADLYYLSGTAQQCHLLLPREGAARLLVRKVIERAKDDSPLSDVHEMKSLRDLRGHIEALCGPPPWRIGMELDVLPVSTFRAYQRALGDGVEIVDASRPILAARSVKSDWEVDQLRAGSQLHEKVFGEVGSHLRDGVSTFDLQTLLDQRACALGHCGIIRMRGLDVSIGIGAVVSGEDGAVPGHSMFPIGGKGPNSWVAGGGSRRPIDRDTPVIVDYLMSTSGYHADCTRMAVLGEFPEEATALLEKLSTLLRLAESQLKAGAIPSAIYANVLEAAKDAGLASGFMGPEGYAVPFIGHSVGLEVNEAPVLAPKFDAPLVAGNTLAVEPKFTHPEFGVVGLENTYLVTDDGFENLSTASEDVIVCTP